MKCRVGTLTEKLMRAPAADPSKGWQTVREAVGLCALAVASVVGTEVFALCDDLHMWLTPFTAGRHHYVFIDLGLSRTLSMLRIWNYNKSRIHSYRGARYMEVCI